MKNIDWEIIQKKLEGRISPSEERSLNDWMNSSPEHLEYFRMAKEFHEKQVEELDLDKVPSTTSLFMKRLQPESRVIISKRSLRYAASILFPTIIFLSVWFFNRSHKDDIANNNVPVSIDPISNKARLITSSGLIVDLETNKNELIEDSSGIKISNDSLMGLKYFSGLEVSNIPGVYNTLITPRGGEYNLELSDGTRVWLNCDSELKYPVVFNGATRKVSLKGEAFFDVSKSIKPFIVQAMNMNIKVLGTRFNISAYSDDHSFQTTLTRGSLKVELSGTGNSGQSVLLQPGQQANFDKDLGELERVEVDTTLYTSWIDGYFRFQDKPLDEVMRSIARWYNIEVVYENNVDIKKRLTGKLYRLDNYTVITSMISKISGIKFDTEGTQVTVSQ